MMDCRVRPGNDKKKGRHRCRPFKPLPSSGRSVFGAIRNLEVIYIEIPGSRFQGAPE
jgi:hypothetical protein